jgi:alkylation response protein AidB-like acyl-CoA dehydrogenase
MTVDSIVSPAGGAFLVSDSSPNSLFTTEEFGPEARLMAQTADEFLRREVLPKTDQIEAHDTDLMARLIRKAGDLGLLGAEVPEVYGGLGLDNRTGALLAEKINWQQSFALSHEAHTVIATLPLLYFGNHEQKAKYLPKLASGEWIGSFALSEAGSGSDALGAQTRAVLSPDGSHYVLNGAKMWITNTAFANLFTVFAKVDGDKFSAFLVERDYPGVSFGPEEHKLGMRGTSTRRVILEDVRVPAENLIGEVGKGHYAAFCALNMGRFKLEAGAVGGIKETIAVCAAYAKQRKQFGKPIAKFGLIQAKLGEMASRCFALESAVYRLAGLLDGVFDGIVPESSDAPAQYHHAAEEYSIECSIVKVVGSDLYSWATDEGIQIHGGYGYTEEFPMARAWRDQRLLRIGEGANEVVRLTIVNTLLRREKSSRIDLSTATHQALDSPCAETVAEETPDSLVRQLKKAGLLLLDLARKEWGDGVLEQQEVVATIADIFAAAYVAESAVLRAKKMAASGRPGAELAMDAALLYTIEAINAVHSATGAAVDHLATADPSGEVSGRLMGELLVWGRHDRIALRRLIAAAALERESYPW